MTREEAKNWLNKLYARADITDEYGDMEDMQPYEEAVNMAIQALEQEPCEEAISRQAIIEAIHEADMNAYDERSLIRDLKQRVNELPPVKPQPKTGYWILADEQNKEDVENDNYRFICSECQCSDIHAKDTIVPYCWKCGTLMVEPQEKYCDRNICIKNEYNGIGCDECEVTKSREPQESEDV